MATSEPVRLDKWLWAARFFKTRALAKKAIEGGKVHVDGQRVKSSKLLNVDAQLRIRCGWDEKTVIVTALSSQRGNAAQAATLYCETASSIASREQRAEERRAARSMTWQLDNRPTKKQRRQIHRFRQDLDKE